MTLSDRTLSFELSKRKLMNKIIVDDITTCNNKCDAPKSGSPLTNCQHSEIPVDIVCLDTTLFNPISGIRLFTFNEHFMLCSKHITVSLITTHSNVYYKLVCPILLQKGYKATILLSSQFRLLMRAVHRCLLCT